MIRAPLQQPFKRAAAVTPNDNTDLAHEAHALFIGGAGNAVVITSGGDTVTFNGLTAGSTLLVRCKRVKSTSTTATNILALWS